MPDEGWWQSFYDDLLADLLLVRQDPEELAEHVAFLLDRLAIKPGCTVFDQCCGIGSLSIPLARRNVRIIGVDQCEAYVRRANHAAQASGLPCRFHQGDAFVFVPDQQCDAAFNWWTSFGYAEDDTGNRRMLQRAFESLRPGGRFALDYPNMACVLSDFKECTTQWHQTAGEAILLLRESTLDLARGVQEQRWTHVLADGRRHVRHSAVRLYLPHELGRMLRECGFVEIEFYGNVRGERLQLHCPRCICLGRRP